MQIMSLTKIKALSEHAFWTLYISEALTLAAVQALAKCPSLAGLLVNEAICPDLPDNYRPNIHVVESAQSPVELSGNFA